MAACLKVYGRGVDPVASSGIFSAPAFQFLIVAFEIFLGVWLLSGLHRLGAWLTVLVAFTGFAFVSFYQGWIGRASCGCFGKVAVHPWVTFTIDLAAVAALLLARPDLTPLYRRRARIASVGARLFLVYSLLLACLALFGHYRYGSIDAALASLRKDRLSVSPALIDMGEGTPGETREASVEVADRPVRLIGGTSDCSCTVLGDLPSRSRRERHAPSPSPSVCRKRGELSTAKRS